MAESAAPLNATLKDGSLVMVRRLVAADAPELEAGFARLSEESRRLRFLTTKPRLSSSELRYLTDIDGHNHEALVAIDPETRGGVGIARFVRDEGDPSKAEVAVTVLDAWQHRGVGTLLLTLLADRAREEGIDTFTALVAADNRSMRRLLERLDPPATTINPLGEAAEYEIELGPRGMGAWLHEALRAAAEGHWRVPPGLWEALRSLLPVQLRGQ
jgi:RimJ/RimL family protein N-acetyltransferase